MDIYNHDEDAATYDQDVLRSDDPVREGYAEVLDWVAVARCARQEAGSHLVRQRTWRIQAVTERHAIRPFWRFRFQRTVRWMRSKDMRRTEMDRTLGFPSCDAFYFQQVRGAYFLTKRGETVF